MYIAELMVQQKLNAIISDRAVFINDVSYLDKDDDKYLDFLIFVQQKNSTISHKPAYNEVFYVVIIV